MTRMGTVAMMRISHLGCMLQGLKLAMGHIEMDGLGGIVDGVLGTLGLEVLNFGLDTIFEGQVLSTKVSTLSHFNLLK